jgi:hypothetical protein
MHDAQVTTIGHTAARRGFDDVDHLIDNLAALLEFLRPTYLVALGIGRRAGAIASSAAA